MLWGLFASFSSFTPLCGSPSASKRVRSRSPQTRDVFRALSTPDVPNMSADKLSELQKRRAELADLLDADLKRINVERRERLLKLDHELSESVEALHRDHVEQSQQVIEARRK